MATPVPVDHYGPGGDGDREKSPSGGTVNLAKSAVSAVGGAVRTVGGYLFRSDEAAAGDKPREPGDPVVPTKSAQRHEHDKCKMEKAKELSEKDEEIRKLKAELTRVQQLAEERRFKFQQRTPNDSVGSAASSDVQHLHDRIREQAQLVLRLRRDQEEKSRRIKELEQTLEMTGSDKSSFDTVLQDIEDERDKVKDDFDNAKEEIRGLKTRIRQLEQELSVTKAENVRFSTEEESATGECRNANCKGYRTKYHRLESDFIKKRDRVAEMEKILNDRQKHIRELELENKKATDDLQTTKLIAETYEADFKQERKDRERARGELEEVKKKKGGQDLVFKEEAARRFKQVNALNQELSKLKTERDALTKTADSLTRQIEAISNERDALKDERDKLKRDKVDLKYEIQQRKERKKQKAKEYDKLKQQLHDAAKGNVKLVEQLEEARKGKKEVSKMVKREQERQRKADKKSKTSAQVPSPVTESMETPQTMVEQLEALRSQNIDYKADIQHFQQVIEILSMGIREGTVLFPADDDKSPVSSPTTDQQIVTTDPTYMPSNDPFQNDHDYVPSTDPDPQPELPLRQHLEKLNRLKQMGQLQESREAGKGDFQHKTEPQTPRKQVIQRDIELKAVARTSDQQYYDHSSFQQQGAQQNSTRPPRPQTLEGNNQEANRRGSSSCQSPVGPPSTGSAAERNKPFRAGMQSVQGQPPPSSDQRRPPLKNQSSQDSDLLTANRSPVLKRQSSREPPPLRAGGPSSEPPLRAGGPSGPNQSQICVTNAPPPHPYSDVIQHPNQHQYNDSTGQFQNAPPHRRAPHNIDGQQHMSEGAPADRRAQMQPPSHTSAGGQQYPSEHAQTHPMANPSAAVVQSPQEDVGYMNISAGARDYGGRSAPIDRQGRQPPPSHVPSAQSQQQYNTESERPAVYGGPGSGKPHVPQAEPLSRRQLHANEPVNPEQFKGINYPALPPEAGTVETQSMGTQISIPYTHPLTEKPPAGHGAKAKAVKRHGEAERENVLVEKIDADISDMAAGVREEVSEENKHIKTMEHKPYDPNLVCPMCSKKHRIGEIQKFRAHVDKCSGDEDGGAQSPPRITSV